MKFNIKNIQVCILSIDNNGDNIWRNLKNEYHRDLGPAKISHDGTKFWYQNGNLHREDGPAVEYAGGRYVGGRKDWYLNGKRHREGGPAIELINGSKHWYQNGKRHNADGPAMEHPRGGKQWWFNGKLHRDDGPAYDYSFEGYTEWWYHGKEITCNSNEEFLKLIKLKAFW